VGIFIIAFAGIMIGLVLILLLKNTAPPPPRERLGDEVRDDLPLFLTEKNEFKEKCLAFFSKFNLDYEHSVWAEDNELEVSLKDETPVVGGLYLGLCVFEPVNNIIPGTMVTGFLDTVKGEGAAKGILVTTGYFSDEARQIVREESIELVDVADFVKYLKKFEIYE
jgi:hypothetical protein